MFTKVEVLARLEKRHAKIAASHLDASKPTQEAVLRTLEALDSRHSHYVVLSAEEREQVRATWTNLAKQIGARIEKPHRALRTPPKVPAEVQKFFGDADCIPQRPRATNNPKQDGMRTHAWADALSLRLVELNPPAQVFWLVFDCDHNDAERWREAGLPEPSFVTINPVNQHHHVAYRLKVPVCRSERGHRHPLAFLRAVKEGLRVALNGDPSYNGILTKNPLHPSWTTIRRAEMTRYSLGELAAHLDLKSIDKVKAIQHRARWQQNLNDVEVGGRNRALFDAVRRWAWQNHDDLTGLQQYAEQCNELFPQPMDFNEVRGIVASIERYMTDQQRACRSGEAFSARQAARGKRGGRPRTTMDSQPWAAEGISRSSWYEQQSESDARNSNFRAQPAPARRGRPPTTKESQPWACLGISRATWYRRQGREVTQATTA